MAPTAEKLKRREPTSSPEVSLSRETKDRAARGPKRKNGDGDATSVRQAGAQIAAAMLEAADPSTGEHSDDVELVVAELCRKLSVNGETREDILVAARLHDVGKVAIPREVLDKKGPLNKSEWKLIKKHTVTGERIVRAVPELKPASVLVRHSHEHFDGSGYPDGLEGEEIPLGSRIILVADAFHAIRSNRPYRKGRKTGPAMKEMKRCAGTQFDPEIVDALDASITRRRAQRATQAAATARDPLRRGRDRQRRRLRRRAGLDPEPDSRPRSRALRRDRRDRRRCRALRRRDGHRRGRGRDRDFRRRRCGYR